MSQVKNLRAMFENKEETSPPDRGRSSGVSTPSQAGPHGTGSPRPLSKVRTSFVAIEKDGRIGLRRDPSGESSVSRRRMSNETDIESISTLPEKSTLASTDETVRPARKLFVNEPIPESPLLPSAKDTSEDIVIERSTREPPTTEPSDDNQPAHEDAKADPPTYSPDASTKPASAQVKTANVTNSKEGSKAPAAIKKSTQPDAPSAKPATKKDATKPSTTSKTGLGTPKKTDAKTTTKSLAKVPTKQNSISNLKESTLPGAKSSVAGAKKPQILKTKASHDAGLVKPKPKSPTKPASLPSSLTAPTASSISKGNTPRQSISRQSGTLLTPTATGRSPSRASVSTTGAPSKVIKRQASTIGRPRPSVGPPPKKVPQSESSTKKPQGQVDEGFLARMMRPTQSSSSKVAEKTPVTPPRNPPSRSTVSSSRSSAAHAGKVKRNDGSSNQTKPLQDDLQLKSINNPVITRTQSPDVAEDTTKKPSDATDDDQTRQLADPKETAEASSPTADASDVGEAVTQAAAVETVDEVVQLADELDQKLSLVESGTDEQSGNAPSTELAEEAVEPATSTSASVLGNQDQRASGDAEVQEATLAVEDKPACSPQAEDGVSGLSHKDSPEAGRTTPGEVTLLPNHQV